MTAAPSGDDGNDFAIYFFAYGPSANPMVRRRRQVKTSEEQPALLPEHRITFAYGGIANLVVQRGYEVHGVLMKFTSHVEWQKFKEDDPGYNELDSVQVHPYNSSDGDEPITAFTTILKDYDEKKLECKIEQLPTERYLKLVGNAMRHYQIDDDYIEDQIFSVPYVPSRKPEDYRKLPQASDPLPKISFAQYQRLCKESDDVYFIVNNKVVRLGPHDPNHPVVIWIKNMMQGERESTLVIHKALVEPELPMVDTLEELTPLHHGWAENHSVEFLRQCDITAIKVYELLTAEEELRMKSNGILAYLCFCFGDKPRTSRNDDEDEKEQSSIDGTANPGSPNRRSNTTKAQLSDAEDDWDD